MLFAKQLILLIIILLCTTTINGQTETNKVALDVTDSLQNNYSTPTHVPLIDSVLNFGEQFLNKPYNYRINPQIRFDCSGFASYVYGNFGYPMKRSSYEQAKQFDTIHRDQLKAGDLVFFSGRRNNQQVGHVGIVVTVQENGKFEFIHSSNHSGIVISKSEEAYYARRYIKAGRVINDSTYLTQSILQTDTTNIQEITALSEKTTQLLVNNNSEQTDAVQYHLVKKGDTLYAIARRYKLSTNELKRINHLQSDVIQPKQLLNIASQNNLEHPALTAK